MRALLHKPSRESRLAQDPFGRKAYIPPRGGCPEGEPVGYPHTIPPTRLVAELPDILLCNLGLNDSNPRIVVRDEYKQAERAALLAAEDGITEFAVTGPGIGQFASRTATAASNLWPGKTMFLLWLLMRRLALRLPAVLQLGKIPPPLPRTPPPYCWQFSVNLPPARRQLVLPRLQLVRLGGGWQMVAGGLSTRPATRLCRT